MLVHLHFLDYGVVGGGILHLDSLLVKISSFVIILRPHLVPDIEQLAGVRDAAPGHVGDVKQAVENIFSFYFSNRLQSPDHPSMPSRIHRISLTSDWLVFGYVG